MLFDSPVPFHEALQSAEVKALLPTSLSSRQLMALAPELRERARFSAATVNASYLQEISDTIVDILNPGTVERDGRLVTQGIDVASARLRLGEKLKEIGYHPSPEDAGTIKDLSSDKRLNLVIKTNTEMAQGYGNWMQGQATLDAFPAQELFRAEDREEPRNWIERWRGAGGRIVGGGRMIALKNDPIWIEISAFGLPYPPFDFNSGMDVRDIDREEAVSLGLIGPDEQIQPQDRGFNDDMQLSNPAKDAQLRAALLTSLGDEVEIDGDVLKWKGSDDESDQRKIRPGDSPVREGESDARTIGRIGEEVLDEIRSSDAGTALPPGLAEIEAAQIASVSVGRKPLFHEQLLPETASDLAQSLRQQLPADIEVQTREGHLYVFRPDTVLAIVAADPQAYPGSTLLDKVHQATLRETNGELLGYGQRQLFQPGSVLVRIIDDTTGQAVMGFFTRPALAATLARAHLKDLADATGRPHRVEIKT